MITHKDYQEIVNRSAFLLTSYNGGFDYIRAKNNLFQYITEGQKKFERRQARAVVYNYFKPIVNSFTNAVFRRDVQRPTTQEQLIRFIEKATLSGKSLQAVMKAASILSTFLNVGILVDNPDAAAIAKVADSVDGKAMVDKDLKEKYHLYPYIKIVLPARVLDWYYDDRGLAWVKIDESVTQKEDYKSTESVEVKRAKIWTRDAWIAVTEAKDSSGKMVEVFAEPVPHGLGEVPFRFICQADLDEEKSWESTVEDIALLQRRIFNLMSDVEENVNSTCHSVILVQASKMLKDMKDIMEQTNEGLNFLPYEAGTNPPQYLRADLVNVAQIMAVAENDRKEIYRMLGAYLNENSFFAQSGVAKEIDYQETEAILRAKAEELEDAENWILSIVAKFENLKLTDADRVEYPDSFKADDMIAELKRDLDIYSLQLSPTLNGYIMENMVRRNYPNMPDDMMQRVAEECRTGTNPGGMPGNDTRQTGNGGN